MISGQQTLEQQYSETTNSKPHIWHSRIKEIGGKLSSGKLMICEVDCGMLTYFLILMSWE